MNYMYFSTASTLQLDVNVFGLAGIDRLFTSSRLGFDDFSTDAFTSDPTDLSFVCNEMGSDFHFSTGSTTSTKNKYKF